MCRMVAGKSAEIKANDFGKCPLISDPLKFPSKHYFHVFWPTNREIVTRLFSAGFKSKSEFKEFQ